MMTIMKKKMIRIISVAMIMIVAMTAMSVCAFADGNVAGAIEGTWKSASGQIKTVVNNVVFPIIDLVLAVFFFAKLGLAYFDCASVKAM